MSADRSVAPARDVMEERLARLGVLHELAVAALDLFDPERPVDDFLERLAVRLGALAVTLLEEDPGGETRLLGAAGISRASRALPLARGLLSEPEGPSLPYPEVARAGLTKWRFDVANGRGPSRGAILIFEGAPIPDASYRGVAARVTALVAMALEHRRLFAHVLEQKLVLESQSEAAIEGILILSSTGRILWCNRRLHDIWHVPDEVHAVRSWDAFLAYASGLALDADALVLPEDPEPTLLDEVRLRDGRILERYVTPIRSPEGIVLGRGLYFRDVTERRLAEEERARLLGQEREARAAAEAARGRLALLDAASAALARSIDDPTHVIDGVRHALPGLADWCLIDLLGLDGALTRRAVASALTAGGHAARALAQLGADDTIPRCVGRALEERRVIHAHGNEEVRGGASGRRGERVRLVRELGLGSYVALPLESRERLLGVLTLVRVGTRAFDEDDSHLAIELARRTALAIDNASLYEQAREAVRARDEFLAIASHEIKSPITALAIAAQVGLRAARTNGAKACPPAIVRGLEFAEKQAQRLASLVANLLDLSRLRAGKLDLLLTDVDLAEVIREAVTHLEADATASGSRIAIHVEEPVVGHWDRLRLEQVVMNVLANAIRYGGGKPIDVTVEKSHATVRLSVTDRGIGIPESEQGRIFERFERGVGARGRTGVGLGLYVARQITRAMGGEITVRSAADAGSTFAVELPLRGARGGELPRRRAA